MKLRDIFVLAIGMALAIGAIRATAQQNTPVPPQAAPANPSAQTQATPDTSHSAPAVSVTTRLVQVSVVVHDKHGNPVTGLTKDDFTLLDNKKPQAIQIFSVRTNQPPAHPPAPLPPNTFTNRVEERGEVPPNVTVILLDALNTEYSDQAAVKRQVLKFLSQIQPQDHVALYTLGQTLHVLQDFTTDSSILIAALQKYKGQITPALGASSVDTATESGISAEVDANIARAINSGLSGSQLQQVIDMNDNLEALLTGALEREAHSKVQNRVDGTVAAMIAISKHVGNVPGRKNLVWVSGSFPFTVNFDDVMENPEHEKMHFSDEVAKAARALTDANIAVYPVDARGLVGLDLGMTQSGTPVGQNAGRVQQKSATQMPINPAVQLPSDIQPPDHNNIDTMIDLAERTGGQAFYNSNDIMGAIRRAVDDSRVTYELGYYPEDVKWDRSFHEIKVKVNAPGGEVRTRKGYFAIPEPHLTDNDRHEMIQEAVESPLAMTGIGITVQMRAGDVPGAREMHTKVKFDPREIHFEQKDGHWAADIEMIYAQIDDKNHMIVEKDRSMQIKITPERYASIQQDGVSSSQDIPVVPNAVELRVILRDNTNGEIGSVRIPLAQYFPAQSSKSQ